MGKAGVSFPSGEGQAAPAPDARLLKRAAMASFIGNFVEWFDYASYGYLAT
ncbi:MAG: MFS transporter, partial [Trinickia sp.]